MKDCEQIGAPEETVVETTTATICYKKPAKVS